MARATNSVVIKGRKWTTNDIMEALDVKRYAAYTRIEKYKEGYYTEQELFMSGKDLMKSLKSRGVFNTNTRALVDGEYITAMQLSKKISVSIPVARHKIRQYLNNSISANDLLNPNKGNDISPLDKLCNVPRLDNLRKIINKYPLAKLEANRSIRSAIHGECEALPDEIEFFEGI